MNAGKVLLGFGVAFVAVAAILSYRNSAPPPAPSPAAIEARDARAAQDAEQRQAAAEQGRADLAKLTRAGLVRKAQLEHHALYVDPVMWSALSLDAKQNIGASMAAYSGAVAERNLPWVEFLDYRNGRRLAKYSGSMGLTLNE